MTIFDVITLLGGLAFFLFGMSIMGNGLKGLAGNRMESILWKLSSNPLKGLLLGTLVTAVIQSSSATTVMVVSFVNAGMMKLAQSITVILGSQIGTTMTGWVLTLASADGSGIARVFSASTFVPVLALVGAALYLFAKKHSAKSTGTILSGFALLMTGMMTMSGAVGPLKTDPNFTGILTLFDNPLLGMLAGTLLAAIIQSCSAGVGILQAISVTGALTLNACLPLIMGINIGACTPVMISMIGSTKNGKRAAVSYAVTSILSIVIIYVIYYPLRAFGLLPAMDAAADSVSIALLNSVIRIVTVILLTPCHDLIEKCCYFFVRFDPEENADSEFLEQLNESALRFPHTAITLCNAAANKMAELAKQTVEDAIELIPNYSKSGADLIATRESLLDKYEDKLGDFTMRLLANESIPELEQEAGKILSSISDLERLGDHALNISELAAEMQEKKQSFSDEAEAELLVMATAVREIIALATEAYTGSNSTEALRVEPLEEVIDIICDELKLRHVSRLQAGRCTIGVGFVFNDLLNNFERISDHCSNLAIYTLKVNNPNYMPHEYASSAEETTSFTDAFLHFTEKYVSTL